MATMGVGCLTFRSCGTRALLCVVVRVRCSACFSFQVRGMGLIVGVLVLIFCFTAWALAAYAWVWSLQLLHSTMPSHSLCTTLQHCMQTDGIRCMQEACEIKAITIINKTGSNVFICITESGFKTWFGEDTRHQRCWGKRAFRIQMLRHFDL